MKTSGEVQVLHCIISHIRPVFSLFTTNRVSGPDWEGGGGKVKNNLLFVHRILNFLSIATDVLFCILPC